METKKISKNLNEIFKKNFEKINFEKNNEKKILKINLKFF